LNRGGTVDAQIGIWLLGIPWCLGLGHWSFAWTYQRMSREFFALANHDTIRYLPIFA